MSTDSLKSFAYGLAVVWRWISEKSISEKNWTITSVGFEPRTFFVRLKRIHHWATQSTVTWSWRTLPTRLSVNTPSLFAVEHHHTKSKPNSIRTLKPSNFRPQDTNQINSDPPHWNQVKFDPPHWNQVKFDPPHWNQVNIDDPDRNLVNLDAHIKIRRFTARIQKLSQFRLPPTLKPNQSFIALKNSLIRPEHGKFRPPHKKNSQVPSRR